MKCLWLLLGCILFVNQFGLSSQWWWLFKQNRWGSKHPSIINPSVGLTSCPSVTTCDPAFDSNSCSGFCGGSNTMCCEYTGNPRLSCCLPRGPAPSVTTSPSASTTRRVTSGSTTRRDTTSARSSATTATSVRTTR